MSLYHYLSHILSVRWNISWDSASEPAHAGALPKTLWPHDSEQYHSCRPHNLHCRLGLCSYSFFLWQGRYDHAEILECIISFPHHSHFLVSGLHFISLTLRRLSYPSLLDQFITAQVWPQYSTPSSWNLLSGVLILFLSFSAMHWSCKN